MAEIYQNIIVGSGPGAVIAAQTLVEAGQEVLMLDFGNIDNHYSSIVPQGNFNTLRQSDENQGKYFLGNNLEAVPSPEITTGAQLTPSRKHIIEGTKKWCPVISQNFFPMESLALGGLGAGWGLGTYVYSDSELLKVGLDISQMKLAYNEVAERIGISAGNDDVSNYIIGDLKNLQKPLTPDNSVKLMLDKYQKNKNKLNKSGIYFGLPSMALLTEDFDGRKATNYSDLDFYTDKNKSAWRPVFVIEKLIQNPNFRYLAGKYVMKFTQEKDVISIESIRVDTKVKELFLCKKLLLGAGALGSAKIALRSLKIQKLPLLCNPYTYLPAINISMLNKSLTEKKTSMAQAMLIYDEDGKNSDLVSVAVFTYKSLLLMRLIQQSPLNIADNRIIFKWLQSAFVIAGIHHPDEYNENKSMELTQDKNSETGDSLKVNFEITDTEYSKIKLKEKSIKRALRKMGVYPIKRLDPGFGSSIHYGGTLPFSNNDNLGTTDSSGKIHGTNNVYVVDGSSFKYLPAKGITFSIMANSHRIAKLLIENG